jgi:hypothetical protein
MKIEYDQEVDALYIRVHVELGSPINRRCQEGKRDPSLLSSFINRAFDPYTGSPVCCTPAVSVV